MPLIPPQYLASLPHPSALGGYLPPVPSAGSPTRVGWQLRSLLSSPRYQAPTGHPNLAGWAPVLAATSGSNQAPDYIEPAIGQAYRPMPQYVPNRIPTVVPVPAIPNRQIAKPLQKAPPVIGGRKAIPWPQQSIFWPSLGGM